MGGTDSTQMSLLLVIVLLVAFYGGTFIVSLVISRREENADAYMNAGHTVGFGISAASMTATWVWAGSFYAAATSGYTYGVSGALHYGLWGALMILFIYPFGLRIRALAPQAHTLAEVVEARHGRVSQVVLASSNVVGSVISLMVNFTAAGALVSVLSPMSFTQGVLAAGVGVLSYTLWSGFRASVLTDVVQLVAMMLAASIIIPWIFFSAGGTELLETGMSSLTSAQQSFFSKEAILEQGAPFFAAILAYAIGNQTIAQRLFAVRPDRIKSTFMTATVGYGSTVIGLGMIGLVALLVGVQPLGGDTNDLIPQMASIYLPPVVLALFFIMVLGSLSSTADSDLAALSSIMMADIYGKNIARGKVKPRVMLVVGRATMVIATALGVVFASLQLDILDMLVFVGALWGAIVFPVISSFYWNRVTATAFNWAVAVSVTLFLLVRFEWVELTGVFGGFSEVLGFVGAGVILGLMAFGFLGRHAGMVVGVASAVPVALWGWGELREYPVLLASLVTYGVSALVCTGLSLMSSHRFDFDVIAQRARDYQSPAEEAQ